jgi:DNA-binding LacI/PurR family transcriptional regulator
LKSTALRNNKLTIGLLTSTLEEENGNNLWSGIANMAERKGVNLICFVGDPLKAHKDFKEHKEVFRNQANILYELINTKRIDALILWGGALSNYIGIEAYTEFYNRLKPIPMVNISMFLEDIHNVRIDNYNGISKILEHLINYHRYTRIAFIQGPDKNIEAATRFKAYKDTLNKYNIKYNPKLVTEPGDWHIPSGRKAIKKLFKQTKLKIDAVTAACDHIAFGAIEELIAMGYHVPSDIAVTGFDDSPDSKISLPSLTTTPLFLYEQGQKAVEILILNAKINKEESVNVNKKKIIITSMLDLIFSSNKEDKLDLKKIKELLNTIVDSFLTDISNSENNKFISTLTIIVYQFSLIYKKLDIWHNLLSIMHKQVLIYYKNKYNYKNIENLFEQARIIISRISKQILYRSQIEKEEIEYQLKILSQELLTSFNINELLQAFANELPKFNIPGCFIVLYKNPKQYEYLKGAPEKSKLIFAYQNNKRIELDNKEIEFPTKNLLPDNIIKENKQYHYVIEPLYFKNSQLGFIILEIEDRTYKYIFGVLRGSLSNALYVYGLIKELENKNSALENAILEIKTLKGIVPICAGCKKIRNDKGYWEQVEKYISTRTDAVFSHGICPDCLKKYHPDYYKKNYIDKKE